MNILSFFVIVLCIIIQIVNLAFLIQSWQIPEYMPKWGAIGLHLLVEAFIVIFILTFI